MVSSFRYLVVGSGFSGAVLAERIAEELGEPVLVLERRDHIGGNAFSSVDEETGIECHRYGSHIFHTRHEDVWRYVLRFGAFSSYRHHVLTEYRDRVYSMPISLDTINRFYDRNLKPHEAEAFIREEAGKAGIRVPENLEEKAISLVGRPLYEAFVKGYTWKQWNRDPRELPPEIINRLPVRASYNTEYFSDPYQGIPLDGFGTLIGRMLAHPRISVRTGVDFDAHMLEGRDAQVFYTGMIDRYFGYRLGELEWRSLRFEYETVPVADYQGVSVMNYADRDVPFTRIHEFKHYHPEREAVFTSPRTVICREYPQDFARDREAYYPVNNATNQTLYGNYLELAKKEAPQVSFCGRLGGYRYCDMDVAIKMSLDLFEQRVRPNA